MASRSFSRALRTPLTRQLTSPATQRRTVISTSKYARTGLAAPLKLASTATFQQTRGVKTIDFAGTKEVVYGDFFPYFFSHLQDANGNAERSDWPSERLLVRPSLSLWLGVFLPNNWYWSDRLTVSRNTSKTIPSPSSATAHKDTGKV